MSTQLEVLNQFNSGGVEYFTGNRIELAAVKTWPEGALEGRLNNGFVRYAPVPVAKKEKV